MIVFDTLEEAREAEAKAKVKWAEQVSLLVSSGWYRSVDAASKFFVRRLHDTWASELERAGVEIFDETDVAKLLGLTPTMQQLIHLFAYGYRDNREELGLRNGKAPVITDWPPLRRGQTLQFFHAIPKRDIAKIIKKSAAAIEAAMVRFRGRGSKGSDLIRDRALVQPIAIPTGVMLDVRLSPQLRFSFMEEDYELGKVYATKHSASATDTWETQAIHCGRGLAKKREASILPRIIPISVPGNEAENLTEPMCSGKDV